MAITKAKKEEISSKLECVAKDSETVVFVGAKGLSAADTATMRASLREQGIGYFVAKKTLMERAFGTADVAGTYPELEGEVAVAYAEDPMAPAQAIKTFATKYPEKIRILGGVFAGAYKDQMEMTEIASIPGIPVLRGMFVNVINAPIQGLVVALGQIAEKRA